MKRILIIVCLLAPLASAQVVQVGPCPTYPPIKDFNVDKFLGSWYEDERTNFVFESGLKCIHTQYAKNADGSLNEVDTSVREST